MKRVFVSPEVVAAAAAVGINVDPTDPNALAYVKEQLALIHAAAGSDMGHDGRWLPAAPAGCRPATSRNRRQRHVVLY